MLISPTPRYLLLCLLWLGCAAAGELRLEKDETRETITIFRKGAADPILTQHAGAEFRPYIHPIVAPDGEGMLTEFSPSHHKHQTGLYWGFTRLNGRDYFHHPEGDHWRRQSFEVLVEEGEKVSWQTSYDLLDEDGVVVLVETQRWEMQDRGEDYLLDLVWSGTAKQKVTISRYDYGGLFLRMPWRKDIEAEALNSSEQRNQQAEGKRGIWLNVGMQVEGRDNLANITLFDHPKNGGYPQPWRVDRKFGVGPTRARLGDWHIAKDQTETIRHRVIVHTGKPDGPSLTEEWKDYTEKEYPIALWQLAQQEGRNAKFLSPQEAVENMTVHDGFKVNAFAAEPMITQPMAFCWDDKGRLWVAENRDYESRQKGFSNSGDSRILILEDTDRDGIADKQTIFAEGIPFPAGIAVGFDGLWLGTPPNLLFVPDRDGDDRADMDDIEVRLTGWGIRDRHETLNSFHWGPDGWLYGCQGFATPSKVGKPKGKGRLFQHRDPFPKKIEFDGKPVDINGGVWRYHPTKDRFEVVAHGFSNPWGIDYDAKGNFFITACVIPHMFHVIPGGIYHRQGGRHFNPYVYQDILTIVDHSHRSAHGGARIYLSDAFPPEHHGRLFMCNIHEHAVLSDILKPNGSGFIASHGPDLLQANNAQWVGFSMELGPDGALYALDWHDADICGKEVLHKETGRVFRIAPERSQAEAWDGRYADLNENSDLELAKMQTRRSSWHARRARLILQNRALNGRIAENGVAHLEELYQQCTNPDHRLRAMWALHVIDAFTGDDLISALGDPDEHVRAWAIQFLNEDHDASPAALKRLAEMATNDPSPVVRLYLASALQRVAEEQRWAIAQGLLSHADDADDHNLPKMIWFGMEALVPKNPTRTLDLARQSKLPLVTEFIARRAAEADAFEALVNALNHEAPAMIQSRLLKGMRDGLEGRRNLKAPEGWAKIQSRFAAAGGDLHRLSSELSQQFGIASATEETLRVATTPEASANDRHGAIRALAVQKSPGLLRALPALFEDAGVQIEAIRAAAAYDNKALGETLLELYPKFSPEAKREVVQGLSTRPTSGWLLTEAIRDGDVPRRDVPSYVARQLRRVVGNGFVEIWGLIDALPDDKAAAFKKYESLLTPEALEQADLKKGHTLFQRTCMACHVLHGEGGTMGPDITGANRGNLDYLLHNILDPSGIIQDDYKMVMITTRDGRTLAGNVASENERQLTLSMVGQQIVLTKSDIQSREVSAVSMMPEGLLQTLSDQESIDLIAYLMQLDPPRE